MGDPRVPTGGRAAVVGVLLIAVQVAAGQPVEAAGEPGGALPATVYGVSGDGGLPIERDLGLGAASVAVANSSDVFLVTADDGAYHRVRLPGYDAALYDAGAPGLSLSPDGRKLAYAWHAGRPPRDGYVPRGARVVDLTTGRIRTGPPPGSGGADQVTPRLGKHAWNFGWSPDGRYLVYDVVGEDSLARRLDWFPPADHGYELVDTTTYRLVGEGPGGKDTAGRPLPVVASAAGTVLRNGNGESLVARTGEEDGRRIETFPWRSAEVTPDGRWMALSGGVRTDLVLVSARGRDVGTVVTLRPQRWSSDGGSLDLLGWTAPDRVLGVVHRRTGPSTLSSQGELVQITLDVDLEDGLENDFPRTPRGRVEVVGLVTGGVPGSVFSFATDLAGTDPPTREFDPPSFVDGSRTSKGSAGVGSSTPAAAARGAGEAARGEDPRGPLTWVLFAVAAVAAIGAGVLVRSSRGRRDMARSGR